MNTINQKCVSEKTDKIKHNKKEKLDKISKEC